MNFTFYLGVHRPNWLWKHPGRRYFVSDAVLRSRKGFGGRATYPWALDSGGYTELKKHGQWTITAEEYARRITRYAEHVGQLVWAAPQDWMCGEAVLRRTGLPVEVHQQRTLESVQRLRQLTAVNVIPVLQGFTPDDYRRHRDLYTSAGFALVAEPVVGIGSVVDRQGDAGIISLIHELAREGLALHAFGFKTTGLRAAWQALASADSMAWSFRAMRSKIRHPDCVATNAHKNCANCVRFAEAWVAKMKADVGYVETEA